MHCTRQKTAIRTEFPWLNIAALAPESTLVTVSSTDVDVMCVRVEASLIITENRSALLKPAD